jgi:predicted ATPase
MQIQRVTLRNFKRFREQTFELQDHVVLAGSNNAGKSTLLQAIAVWNLGRRKWLENRSRSKASQPKGVGITRRDFTAIPLREMNLLWTDAATSLRREEAEAQGHKQGHPRPMAIELQGVDSAHQPWELAFEFVYQNAEMVSVRPLAHHRDGIQRLSGLDVIHVPAFSGIGAEETVLSREYQDHLIGQGKPGDIVRNLLKETWQRQDGRWEKLVQEIRDIFGYELLPPDFEGRTFIVCEYLKQRAPAGRRNGGARLDVATAGSGFHQVLMLLAFLHAREGSVLLLDEPDAHLHTVLQGEIYDRLRETAARRQSQLLIATHSEVIINRTSPANITSFYRQPHALQADVERQQVQEALKRLSSLDLLLADSASGFLYVESETDFRLLRAWSRTLKHPLADWFEPNDRGPAWQEMRGRNPREARGHFFALKAVRPQMRGLVLLDSDNRHQPLHDLRGEGLDVRAWPRYEAESYLLVPETLARFVEQRGGGRIAAEAGMNFLREQLPPAFFHDPHANGEFIVSVAASKTLLPGFFAAAGMPGLRKADYFLVAEQMLEHEVHVDVCAMLDAIVEVVQAPGDRPA